MQLTELRKNISDEIENAYIRIYQKKLPPFLTTSELGMLNIRASAALDKDSCQGCGLLPLPATSRGKPRRYLLSTVIDFLVGGQPQHE